MQGCSGSLSPLQPCLERFIIILVRLFSEALCEGCAGLLYVVEL
jgi:hypothetical protein